MKRSRFTEEQIIGILKEHQAGLGAKELKALEAENAKLKKLLAEQMMDVSTLKEMLGKNF
jgi:putative transposase